jgi:DNA adenine methylase
LTKTPEQSEVFQRWKGTQETDPVWQAVRFLVLSNWSYYGQADTLRHEASSNDKQQLLKRLDATVQLLETGNIDFHCCDFRDMLDQISYRKRDFGRDVNPKTAWFLYFDPPYYNTGNIYHDRTCTFTQQDTEDVFRVAVNSSCDFMISEFDSDVIRDLACRHRLHVTPLMERRTMGNRNTELVMTNYEPRKQTEQIALFAA